MAYRSSARGSGRLVTRLDTPPFSHRHHPLSAIALAALGFTILAVLLAVYLGFACD
jgi:hypothetical protein